MAFKQIKGAGMEKWEQEALLRGEWDPKQPDMEEEFDQISFFVVSSQ